MVAVELSRGAGPVIRWTPLAARMAAAAAGCWTCDMCTFENAAAQGFCQMCEYSKPKAGVEFYACEN